MSPSAAAASAPAQRKPAARRSGGAATSRAARKPAVVAVVTPEGVDGCLGAEQRPLIAHLHVSTAQLDFVPTGVAEALTYDPAPPAVPVPYDAHGEVLSYLEGIPRGEGVGLTRAEAPLAAVPEAVEGEVEASTAAAAPVTAAPLLPPPAPAAAGCATAALLALASPTVAVPAHYSERLMVQYQDSNRLQTLPERTDVLCFWCCHAFDTRPCVLPSHITRDVWHVYGSFCGAACAAAHLFHERLDAHVQWERYALLNRLYAPEATGLAAGAAAIRCAPPREVLRAFGGSLDIREFRGVVSDRKLRIDVLTPPMISIIQTMDTKPIDFYDQSLRNVFITHDARQRLAAAGAQGLRLRRTKPIKDWENTLECVMRLAGGGSSAAGAAAQGGLAALLGRPAAPAAQ